MLSGFASVGYTAVSGPCSNCHTMHNSQDGSSLAETWVQGSGLAAAGPQQGLLKWDCIGCHTGGPNTAGGTPYVFDTSAPTYGATGTSGHNTLAGGSFYWVTTDHATGHNVEGIVAIDGNGTLSNGPPGFQSTFDQNGAISGGTWDPADRLTCAGTTGCHGQHHDGTDEIDDMIAAVRGAHHGDDTDIDGLTVATSYRFLYGILGIEDDDRELTVADGTANHNQYHGVDGGTSKRTISYLCAECHGQFHKEKGTGSPWLRHPTDFDMGNVTGKEYGLYNGGPSTGAPYSVITPVANDLVAIDKVQTTVFNQADDAIITCVSCHRAHGSPYYKLMRWDYANGIGGYCTNCHTSKN